MYENCSKIEKKNPNNPTIPTRHEPHAVVSYRRRRIARNQPILLASTHVLRVRRGRPAGRHGPTSPASSSAGKVCIHWRAGRCIRFPCHYLHSELPEAPPKRPSHRPSAAAGGGGGGNCVVSSTREKPCKFFLSGDCRYGDQCRYLHAGAPSTTASRCSPRSAAIRSKDGTIWDTQTGAEMSLSEPTGRVHALAVGNGMLFAAIQVWDLATLQWTQTLSGHTGAIMSLLCWDQFLLSSSLDQTIKVWATMETGSPVVTYTHNEDDGALALACMQDAQLNPILLCSTNDNIVHLYELPSFANRDKISFEAEVGAVKNGPGGLIFTGDEIGELKCGNGQLNELMESQTGGLVYLEWRNRSADWSLYI
uniref:C3H1-type domain-containing protein n=1 Tax=Oryza punctata TaxID=4537 RepID=A0A0E0KU63_ORYPU